MGFLDRLMGDAGKLVQNLRNDKTFKTGLLSTMALVASADGEIEDDEIDAAFEAIQKNDKLKGFDHAELRREFMTLAHQASNRVDRFDLRNNVSKLASKPDQARLVIGLAEEVAMSDGEMEAPEVKELTKLCQELGLNAKDFDFSTIAAVK